jgi:hypothetical protein
MYYTELRIQNEQYQSRVNAAWENRVRAESASRLFNHGPTNLSLHSNPIQQSLDARNLVGKVQSDSISHETNTTQTSF